MARARACTDTTTRFADTLIEMAELAGWEVVTNDAAEVGWMVEPGAALDLEVVHPNGDVDHYLVFPKSTEG